LLHLIKALLIGKDSAVSKECKNQVLPKRS
jgi:hypothetical protein